MRKVFYFLVFFTLFFLGCADKAPRVETKIPQNVNIVFEQESVKNWLIIENAVSIQRDDSLIEIEIIGKNKSSSTKSLTYKIDWFDQNGFIVKSILSKWKIASVDARKNIIIHAISPSNNASDYKMRISLPTEEDKLRDKNVNLREYH